MKKSLIIVSIATLVAAGFANSAPGGGGGGGGGGASQKQAREQQRMEKQVREHQDDARGKATRTEEQTRTRDMREGETAGNEQSAEMRSRQQERKEIQDQYRTEQRAGEGEKVKGKKPWWKFWGSEDEPE